MSKGKPILKKTRMKTCVKFVQTPDRDLTSGKVETFIKLNELVWS